MTDEPYVPPSQQGATYNVDIIMCIDTTGSMQPVIDTVKRSALSFYDDLKRTLDSKSKIIDNLRVKIIDYRDIYVDGPSSIRESSFFRLPDDLAGFEAFVRPMTAQGGGDEPESGLEALSCAIQSDWVLEGHKQRHVIIVYTDASAHPLDAAISKPAHYPPGLPRDFNELTDLWEEAMIHSAKRMILFAPDAYPWSEMASDWDNLVHWPSQAGDGLSEVDYSTILDLIANSV